ncbi:MAG: NAD(P)H-dependent oxidoreductase [Cyclobacteriaceae bacterium]|nr:NAD(P)H-dependent oxidoreductase [Cyclobacteriaceae bacterium]
MIHKKSVLAICGSTRSNSTNEAILKGIATTYSSEFKLELYQGISDLPHFNPDIADDSLSPFVKKFRDKIMAADGILICTPEYVFSLPGALKNAIEWTVSTTVFLDKPTALIVASGIGEKTFESLKLIMTTVGSKMNEDSSILIQGARSKFNQEGMPVDEIAGKSIEKMMKGFISLFDS